MRKIKPELLPVIFVAQIGQALSLRAGDVVGTLDAGRVTMDRQQKVFS